MLMSFMEIFQLDCYAVPELPPSRNHLHNCNRKFNIEHCAIFLESCLHFLLCHVNIVTLRKKKSNYILFSDNNDHSRSRTFAYFRFNGNNISYCNL